MRVAEFARDMTQAPSSEDVLVVSVNGTEYPVTAVEFGNGQVRILTDEADSAVPPVALAEKTAEDQARLGDGTNVPGHADVMSQAASGAGIAQDMRGAEPVANEKDQAWQPGQAPGQGHQYHAGPEQPSVPVQEDQVRDDSGT